MSNEATSFSVSKALHRNRAWHRVGPLLIGAVAVALLIGVVVALAVIGAFADTDSTLEQAARQGCERNNILREEVNRQAEAFVHHNDSTLAWAIKVRPVLADGGTPETERAYRATGVLIRAYREVRLQYFKLPPVNCESPDPTQPQRPTELIPHDMP